MQNILPTFNFEGFECGTAMVGAYRIDFCEKISSRMVLSLLPVAQKQPVNKRIMLIDSVSGIDKHY